MIVVCVVDIVGIVVDCCNFSLLVVDIVDIVVIDLDCCHLLLIATEIPNTLGYCQNKQKMNEQT